MAGISFSGLASGIDSQSIVSSMVSVAKIPINKLTSQKSTLTSQSKKLTDIKTKLTTLQTAAKALDSKSEAQGNKVTTSDEKVLKATAQGGSSMGSYKITISSLAQAERSYSKPFTSSTEVGQAGQGTLTIKVGEGEPLDIEVDTQDSLATIAKKINASGAQVTAGVFHDGTSYRLQVTGRAAGEKNAIAFTEGGSLSLGLTEKQKATDAVLLVDEIEVRSATNSVTGVIPGVTLNLVDKGTSVVNLDRDGDGLKTKLDSFVTAYNDVMKALNTEFTSTSGVAKSADSLSGDSTLRSLQTTLRSLAQRVTGNGDSKYNTLASIGVASARDGTLSIDATKYNAAVAADYEGVSSLLAGRTDGNGAMSAIATGLDQYTSADGALRTKIDGITNRNKRIDTQIGAMQGRIDKYEEMLNKQYSALEQTMAGLQSQGTALSSIIS
jgi:flagellar hook-associated protein 2